MIFKDNQGQLCWQYCLNSKVIAIPNKYDYITDEGHLLLALSSDGHFNIIDRITNEIYEHGNQRTIEKAIDRLDKKG